MEISIATIIGVVILWFWLLRDKDYSKKNDTKSTNQNYNNSTNNNQQIIEKGTSISQEKETTGIMIISNTEKQSPKINLEIMDIPNIGDSINDIERKLEEVYISKEYIDYCDSLEYKINVYSDLLKNSYKAEVNFHVSSFFRDKNKDTCLKRTIIAPIQVLNEFIEKFNEHYLSSENNCWFDKHNGNIIHKIKIKENIGLIYIDSRDKNYGFGY